MKTSFICSFFLLVYCGTGWTQILDSSRRVDWTRAGLRDTTSVGFIEFDMQSEGLVGDGITPNDLVLEKVLSSNNEPGLILNFPAGNFLFTKTIHLPGHVVFKGQGAEQTILTMDLNGNGHSFSVKGTPIHSDTSSLIISGERDSNFVCIADPAVFSVGDWVQIIQFDSDLVTSSWAKRSVGQMVQVRKIFNEKIEFVSPLRMNFELTRSPFLKRIDPVENVGIECLKIHRIDDAAPQQASNIHFAYAVNCWVNGVESENCTFSHIQANQSSNLLISRSYFHHGFTYGGGGRAYGVMLQFASNECLVEDNIFEHLRHSMIVQAGANGNVFAYNYSFDPYWDFVPNDAAGDIVLHGNYVFANLFEQNICQNIVIDNSHGPNGPYNTFFRNRSESFGIFFSADNSPGQNLIGNEIPNTTFPYALVNYFIQGSNHLIYGNNNKGTIHPSGTSELWDSTYAFAFRPPNIPVEQWAGIGTPNLMGVNTIPALDRYDSGALWSNACNDVMVSYPEEAIEMEGFRAYPNPVYSTLTIEGSKMMDRVSVLNALGQVIYTLQVDREFCQIDTGAWGAGMYYILISYGNRDMQTTTLIKI